MAWRMTLTAVRHSSSRDVVARMDSWAIYVATRCGSSTGLPLLRHPMALRKLRAQALLARAREMIVAIQMCFEPSVCLAMHEAMFH